MSSASADSLRLTLHALRNAAREKGRGKRSAWPVRVIHHPPQTGVCGRRRWALRGRPAVARAAFVLAQTHLERVLLLRGLLLHHVDAARHAVADDLDLLVVVPHARIRAVVHEAVAAEGGSEGGENHRGTGGGSDGTDRNAHQVRRASCVSPASPAAPHRPVLEPGRHSPHPALLAFAARGRPLDARNFDSGRGRITPVRVRRERAGDGGVRCPLARAKGAHSVRAGRGEGGRRRTSAPATR